MDTFPPALWLSSQEARKTISFYRALNSGESTAEKVEEEIFAKDAPLAPPRPPTYGIRKSVRDRAERIRLAGGPKPSLRDRALAFAQGKDEVRAKEFTDIGVPRQYLAWMCEEGMLEKVAYGRYRAKQPDRAT